MDDEVCGAVGGMIGTGSRSTGRKPAPVSLCSADPGSNPSLPGGKPATNSLSYGTASANNYNN
jgi:hypothetical protein